MDISQIEYILKIAEEKNISRAAEKLFITQSALNQKLIKLEKEIGAPLFYRMPNKLELTEIGKVYVDNARKIRMLKTNMSNEIADLLEPSNRRYSIGVLSNRGITIFTSVYPQFLKLHPNVSISPKEMNCFAAQNQILSGQLDLSLLTVAQNQKIPIHYIPLYREEFFLAVPASHPLVADYSPAEKLPEISLRLFKDELFVQMYANSTQRAFTDDIFAEYGISPQLLFETSGAASIPQFVSSGLCCALIPSYYTQGVPDIRLFRLPGRPTWEVTFGCQRSAYLSKPLKTYIRLTKQFLAPYYPEQDPTVNL